MSLVRPICSKDELESYFRQDNIMLHLYEIGDLDDFFWSSTSWNALENEDGDTKFISLMYGGADPPVIIALGWDIPSGVELLSQLHKSQLLPHRFYSHLSLGLSKSFCDLYHADHHGRYLKMGLVDSRVVKEVDVSCAQQLLPVHLPQVEAFYRIHYPGNWFDARMLETKQTYGVWSNSRNNGNGNGDGQEELLAIAGVHVFSTTYRVAALGNIAVHVDHRSKKLARIVTAALVQSLLREGIEHIGLNVLASNAAAVTCYKNLGFTQIAEFEEIMWSLK